MKILKHIFQANTFESIMSKTIFQYMENKSRITIIGNKIYFPGNIMGITENVVIYKCM